MAYKNSMEYDENLAPYESDYLTRSDPL